MKNGIGGLNERSRIGGKGMTYKVLNCPAYNDMPNMYDEVYGYCDNEHDIDLDKCMCENITDCVIKQVINKCKYYQNKIGRTPQYRAGFIDATSNILQLFDIEEIKK